MYTGKKQIDGSMRREAEKPIRLASDGFTYHLNGAARTLCSANSAALAIVVIESVALIPAQLNDCVVWTNTVTVIALKAVAARQAPARLK